MVRQQLMHLILPQQSSHWYPFSHANAYAGSRIPGMHPCNHLSDKLY